MATIQIRNVPEDVAATYKVRAAKAGQSLQEYMLAHLTAVASKPTVEELMERIQGSSAGDTFPDLPLDVTLQGIKETWD